MPSEYKMAEPDLTSSTLSGAKMSNVSPVQDVQSTTNKATRIEDGNDPTYTDAAIQHSPGAYEAAPGEPNVDETTNDDENEKYLNDGIKFNEKPYPLFPGDKPWSERSWWYEIIPFRGMYYDVRRRLPFFVSDWTTAFAPRNWWTVAQYVVRMYFINLMPAISYVLDMYHRTNGAYGVNEVILASALAAIVFPIFSIQPLTFVGVTGLINLVNYTQYDIVVGYYGLSQMDYLRVQAWSLIWAAGFHFIVSIFNLCDFTRFITDMTSQTFGFYVGIVYIQKGIELLILEYEPAPLDNATGWLSVTIAILFTVSVYLVSKVGQTSFLPFKLRYLVSSFAFTAGIIFWTGFSNFPEYSLRRVPLERLPITKSFFPTMDRSWFIDFWNIELRWVFVGAPLGFLIMLLFYFDHNVSSVMAQSRSFPVKRPAGFHWDFFLLGITTFVSGILGLPAPNGLVPQCPWSTDSLSVYKQVDKPKNDEEEKPLIGVKGKQYNRQHIINTRVVENRVGHLIVGLLTIGTMTRPLLVVLGTMPRALFAGVFILVGWSSIEGNGITTRTLAIFKDRRLSAHDDPLLKVKRSKVALYVGIQWIFFALTIAISQTIAAIGFPVLIVLLIPFRYWIVPLWFSPIELRILDAPTADADVVLASIGHETEAVTGQGLRIARDTKIAGTEWNDDDDDDDGHHGMDREYHERKHEKRPTSSTLDMGKRPSSHVKGYKIGDEEEDDEDEDVDQFITLTADNNESGGSSSQVLRTGSGAYVDGAKTPEVDPEGHYRAWLKGPIGGEEEAERNESARPVTLKETKRSKSVTQSWWGKGRELEAVERAPTPHTPATPIDPEDGQTPLTRIENAKRGSTLEVPLGTAGGAGLTKWLNSKIKKAPQAQSVTVVDDEKAGNSIKATSTPEERSLFAASPTSVHHELEGESQPVQSINVSGTGAFPSDAPLPAQSIDSKGANLFLAGGMSPSQAGEAAANAVREIQSSADETPIHHSMVPNISDTQGSVIRSSSQGPAQDQQGHSHAVLAAVKDILPNEKPNADAVVEAVKEHFPKSGSSSKEGEASTTEASAQAEKPFDSSQAGSSNVAVSPAPMKAMNEEDEKKLEKEKKELEKAKAKESKAEAKRLAKEQKQKEKEEARKKKEDAKRQKEDEELQAVLAKQANARAESEEKRRKLEEQIKALENKTSSTKKQSVPVATEAATAPVVATAATEAFSKKEEKVAEPAVRTTDTSSKIVPQPKIISKNELLGHTNQVAGHDAAVYTTQGGDLVVKPCLPGEAEFYPSALVKRPSGINKSQIALLNRLSVFLPTYHGTVDIDEGKGGAATRAVIIENLTRGYKHANVLDLKLGKQFWDESSSAEKRARMDESSKSTTSGTTGIRLTGWQVWDSITSQTIKVDKAFGKGIRVDQLEIGLRSFFGLGSEVDAETVSQFTSSPVDRIRLPVKAVERIISDGILPALKELNDIIKKLEWRVRGGSLLIVYEGDPEILTKRANKAFPRAGRSLKQKDDPVDISELSTYSTSDPVDRLVDVRLIDFAHATFTPGQGKDEGYLSGLQTTNSLLTKLAKDARKGKIGLDKKDSAAVSPAALLAAKEKAKKDEKETARTDDNLNSAMMQQDGNTVSAAKDAAQSNRDGSSQGNMKGEEAAALAAAPALAAVVPLAAKDKNKDESKAEPSAKAEETKSKEDKPHRFASIFGRKSTSDKKAKDDGKKEARDEPKPNVTNTTAPAVPTQEETQPSNVSKDAPVLPELGGSQPQESISVLPEAEKTDSQKEEPFNEGLAGAVGAGSAIGAGSILLSTQEEKSDANEKHVEPQTNETRRDESKAETKSAPIPAPGEAHLNERVATSSENATTESQGPVSAATKSDQPTDKGISAVRQDHSTDKKAKDEETNDGEKGILATIAGATGLAAASAAIAGKDEKDAEEEEKKKQKEAEQEAEKRRKEEEKQRQQVEKEEEKKHKEIAAVAEKQRKEAEMKKKEEEKEAEKKKKEEEKKQKQAQKEAEKRQKEEEKKRKEAKKEAEKKRKEEAKEEEKKKKEEKEKKDKEAAILVAERKKEEEKKEKEKEAEEKAERKKKEEEEKQKEKEKQEEKDAQKQAKEARKESSEANSEKKTSRFSSLFVSSGKHSQQPSSSESDQASRTAAEPSKENQFSGPSFSGAPSGGQIDTRSPQEIEEARANAAQDASKHSGVAALFGPLVSTKKHDSSPDKGSSFSAAPAGEEVSDTSKERKKSDEPKKKSSKIGLFGLGRKSSDDRSSETKDDVEKGMKSVPENKEEPPALPSKVEPTKKEPTQHETSGEKREDAAFAEGAGAALLVAPTVALASASHKHDDKRKGEEINSASQKPAIAGKTDEKQKEDDEEKESTAGLFGLIRRKTRKGKSTADEAEKPVNESEVATKHSREDKMIREEAAKAKQAAEKAVAEAEKARQEAKKAHEEAEKAHAELERVKKERQKAEEAAKKAAKASDKERAKKDTVLPVPVPLPEKSQKTVGRTSADADAVNEAESVPRTSMDAKSSKSSKRKSGLALLGFGGKKTDENKLLPLPPKKQEEEQITSQQAQPRKSQSKEIGAGKSDVDGSAADAQIPPEILAAIQTGDQKDIPPPTPDKSTRKSIGEKPSPIEKGQSSANGNGKARGTSLDKQQLPPKPEESQQDDKAPFWKLGGGAGGLARSLTQKKKQTSEPHPAATVEEVIEETKHGSRKLLMVTNPPRGSGRAASAVQWRDPK